MIARHAHRGASLAVLCAALALLGLTASSALAAETPAPGYQVFGRFAPTNLHPGSYGELLLQVFDTGAAVGRAPLTITDSLPPGLEAVAEAPSAGNDEEKVEESPGCSGASTVTCMASSPQVGGIPYVLHIPFKIAANAEELNPDPAPDVIEFSGGGAAEGGRSTVPVHFGSTNGSPGFAKVDGWVTDAEGATVTQAGSHPYEFTFAFSTNSRGRGGVSETPVGEAHTLRVTLPPGGIGSAAATPICPRELFDAERCPPSTQVGINTVSASGATTIALKIYNLKPPNGTAAQFAFNFNGIGTFINSHVRTGVDNTLYQEIIIPQRKILFDTTTIWGVPSELNGGGEVPKALITTPTSCDGPPTVGAEDFGTWQDPETNYTPDPFQLHNTLDEPIGFSGCERLQFEPRIEGRPTTNLADSPTGFDFDLHVPQNEDPEGLATSDLRDATVTLPEGLVVNPSSANGLAACTEAQIGFKPGTSHPYEFTPEAPHCPEASKLGTVEVNTPLLAHPLPGSVYLAQQDQNPFGSLLALYAVVDDPVTGIVIKLPGLVKADPLTGRLVTTFEESPQLPFNDFHLDFFAGAHASLKTPATCGRYETTTDMTPWSGGADTTPADSFEVSQAAGGSGACPRSESAMPDAPAFNAGTLSTTAGAYSPLVFKVSRPDGSQRISQLDTTLPPGLLGKLAGVGECPAADIAAAEARSKPGEGALEQAHPSCPANSEVASVEVGAGAGPDPVYVSGHAYLAGPYKGAPLSLAIITPALAGPFDLGTTVVRTALYVNPETGQIHAASDPLPTIIAGIPLDVRSVALRTNRPNFTLNPTNCDPLSVLGATTSLAGQLASLSNPFQVGECSRLAFKPKLKLKLKGGTKRNQNPAFTATLTMPAGNANIAAAQVTLPHSEFLDQGHIKTICTRVQFAEGNVPGEKCPAGSIYGHAKAVSPLLEMPLEGPVYLRSSSHRLPDLILALNGQIDVALDGIIDTGKDGGIRNTFEVVPDAPVSKFTLELNGGKKGLLVNSENICNKPQHTIVDFTGQNGKVSDTTPLISNSCPKKSRKGHKHKDAHR